MDKDRMLSIARAALIGQAVGDALGVPAEFSSRPAVRSMNIKDMLGSDTQMPYATRWGTLIPSGAWSDDTSMTLASFDSFARNGGRIDYGDQLASFVRWWDEGQYCCLDFPFGLGGNISAALGRFRRGLSPLKCGGTMFFDNGNGALMRILPFSLYCAFRALNRDETALVISNASSLTHAHDISKMSCFAWTEFMKALIAGKSPQEAVSEMESTDYSRYFSGEALKALSFITERRVRGLSENDIGETGYVVDALQSALWSVLNADSFESAVLNAVNLGFDTDTDAAITGSAAGIIYGLNGIPDRWLSALRARDKLEDAAERFALALAKAQ